MTADILTEALPNVKAKHFAHALKLCATWGGVLEIEPARGETTAQPVIHLELMKSVSNSDLITAHKLP